MGVYYNKALKYSDNANKIIELLDSAIKETKEIDLWLEDNNSQFDYVTNRASKGNEDIRNKIIAIQEKLEKNATNLKKEGRAIDNRIETEDKSIVQKEPGEFKKETKVAVKLK